MVDTKFYSLIFSFVSDITKDVATNFSEAKTSEFPENLKEIII